MRILLDEQLPHRLALVFTNHEATTVSRMGWSGLKNGELLRQAASDGFDVLLTVDRGLRYQQTVAAFPIAVIIMLARSNKLEELLPLVSAVLQALSTIEAGNVVEVGPR